MKLLCLVAAALKAQRSCGINDDRRGIGHGSGQQPVGAALTELQSSIVDEGAAGPRGAGIIDDECGQAVLGE